MSKLTHCELRNGIWSGRLEGSADAPNVIATYHGVEIADMSVTPISGNIWSLELPLPLEMLLTVFTAVSSLWRQVRKSVISR